MSLNIIIKLFIGLNLVPVSYEKGSGKVFFSWYSWRTIVSLSVLYVLALTCLIYYTQMSYAFVPGTPMEYARYTFILESCLMILILTK